VTDYKFGPEENKMAQLGTADNVMDFASDFLSSFDNSVTAGGTRRTGQ
jgi:hypothetical protein